MTAIPGVDWILGWFQNLRKEKPNFDKQRKRVGKINVNKVSTKLKRVRTRRASRQKNVNHWHSQNRKYK